VVISHTFTLTTEKGYKMLSDIELYNGIKSGVISFESFIAFISEANEKAVQKALEKLMDRLYGH
jgi:hypothetical protein